jgi:hypothetical protein
MAGVVYLKQLAPSCSSHNNVRVPGKYQAFHNFASALNSCLLMQPALGDSLRIISPMRAKIARASRKPAEIKRVRVAVKIHAGANCVPENLHSQFTLVGHEARQRPQSAPSVVKACGVAGVQGVNTNF